MKKYALLTLVVGLALVLSACAPAAEEGAYSANITATAEFPAPTLDGATPSGEATAMLNNAENTLTLNGNFTGLTGPATAAHIHGPAREGDTAGVVFPLQVDSATSGTVSGTWTGMTAEQVQQLRDGLYYVNIHTEMNPPGEIRGQLR